ncbi:3-oxoacyl-[acyl-carrier-protein] synthase II, chloroplastic-like [Papaver somniferum]|uniref:3-oxoacyl-[acyl-carrier-protein] synthase II, chloroplastic-like n=1 Tax=Papaver somniferum TaxID=3469 RepID=UPI000E6FB3A1|nr:3-oxoacyl-[acyl-carrier-protein] synthase II, chloroplastic-like [Papaver somniferum]XP_026431277.1 3-oxoacyl-[acyl-carrier-protein] synthase II, chloroplastic-like [Papaver somniferum]XP_026431279.1 3-oxoacyl-[acyl-carrier-protein] synthase II, chloroplastic-like [Papaver somniferum]
MVLTEVCMNTTMASSITEQHHNKGYQVPNANHRQNYNQRLRVYSTKSMICQLLGAAGAVDAVALVQATRTGWVYPNVNLENPEAGVDTKVLVGPKKERLDIKVALSNSFGFGGHNSPILFSPCKP